MRKTSLSVIRKVTIVFFAFYILIYYGLLVLFPNQSIILSDLLSLLGEGISLAIITLGLRWQGTAHKAEWKIFAFGIILYFTGDFIWSTYEVLLHQEVPSPSLCDVFYICSSICYFIAFIYYIRQEKLFDIVRTGFDILITMVVSTTVIVKYVLLPISNDVSLTFFQKIISLDYPILDIGYLGGIFSLIFFCTKKLKFNRANLLISAAFVVWFLADQLYLILSSYSYVSGGFLDPLWPAGCWILALASLYPLCRQNDGNNLNPIVQSKKRHLLAECFGFLLPYISITLISLLVGYQYIFKDPLVAGTVIAVQLILLRQIFSLVENKRLIRLIQKSNQLLEENKVELEESNRKLQQLNYLKEQEANTDFLTGIFNRRYINEILRLVPEKKTTKEKIEISILLIDIDHFKQVNDQWGHEMGDAVIRQVAILIKKAIRTEDVAARYGGDEFIVIMPNTDLQYAESIAERILRKVSLADYIENGQILNVTLSIGCTQWKGFMKDYDANTIISRADRALYKAKSGGRNQYKTEA